MTSYVTLTYSSLNSPKVDANSVGEQGSTFRFFVRMTTAPTPLQLAPKIDHSQANGDSLPLKSVVDMAIRFYLPTL